MKCSFCEAENERSTVTPDMYSSSTCMAFSSGHYDEDGQWVKGRDPNWHTRGFTCSRGHYFKVTSRDGEPDAVSLISTLTTSGDFGASGGKPS